MGALRIELDAAFEWLASALFPTPCVSCPSLALAAEPPLCGACWSSLPRFSGARCRCGRGSTDGRCAHCAAAEPAFDAVFSLGPFEGPLRAAVHALKYRGRHRTAEGLARRIVENEGARTLLSGVDAVVAVPLGPARERDRGFNQAELLAEALARRTGLRTARLLRRARETAPQTGLGADARALNVRGAFEGVGPAPRTLLLVDDVATTGATLEACSLALKAAGASIVRAVTVARAE